MPGANRKEVAGDAKGRKQAATPRERSREQKESKSPKGKARKAGQNGGAKKKPLAKRKSGKEPKQREHYTQGAGLPECARSLATGREAKKTKDNSPEQPKKGRKEERRVCGGRSRTDPKQSEEQGRGEAGREAQPSCPRWRPGCWGTLTRRSWKPEQSEALQGNPAAKTLE